MASTKGRNSKRQDEDDDYEPPPYIVYTDDHHRQYIQEYKRNITPKAYWALHIPSEMKLVGPLREFSTIRFEGSFIRIKQKSYFNFLNLPLTVANFYAFRESFSALYQSPAQSD